MSAQRAVRLTTAVGDKLRFRRMSGEEALGRPFQFELELGSDDAAIDLADLLGTGMAVEIDILGGGKRHFHGLVARAGFVGFDSDEARYRVSLRPWLWFLTRTADCRIFQDKTARDIVHAIFAKYTDSSVHVEDRLQASYAVRNYCVQYRESDLDFVDRLLQDEGATYFFVHDADRHTLVLADAPEAYRASPDYVEVPYYPPDNQARRERDHVNGWDAQAEVRTGSFVHTSFDFERSRTDLLTRRDLPLAQAGWAEGEVYDYSGNYTVRDLGQQTADLRLEADQAEHRLAFGEGTAAGLYAGCRFTLTRYPRADQNIEYLVREVAHEVVDPAYRSGEMGGEEIEVYRCRFTAMPADVPYRPALTAARPMIRGPQTAMVTGPAGEEIWTDRFSRVKLQFHWDREGQRDEKTSCWVRVSQAWAGTGFGAMVIPRIGQEVIVDFLEGDPDRPIVTGRVYNDQAMPPYPLPGGQNQSGLKSNSTKGGGGSNELMFDDTKGKEKVTIHAQYDMGTTVEHDQTNTVINDFKETIKNNATIEISKGNYSHDIQTGTAKYHIKGLLTENYDAAQNTTVKDGITIKSTSGTITVSADGKDIYVHAKTNIELHSGSSKLKMASDGTISLTGKDISVIGSASVKVSAPKIEITGDQEVKTGVGSQSITCNKAKVETSGAAINSSAVGMHEITGAVVKIN